MSNVVQITCILRASATAFLWFYMWPISIYNGSLLRNTTSNSSTGLQGTEDVFIDYSIIFQLGGIEPKVNSNFLHSKSNIIRKT